MGPSFEIVVVFVLLAVNGLLAMTEIAVVSSRKTRLQQLADENRTGARTALKITNDPSHFLSTVQIGISLVGVVAGAYGGATIAKSLAVVLQDLPLIAKYAEPVSVTIVVLLITFAALVVGELVPKQIGLRHPESIACAMARPMQILTKLTYPAVLLLAWSSKLLLKLFRASGAPPSSITEEELKVMIDNATEAGVVKESEQDMMKGILSLGDLTAYDLMTPRHEMVVLDIEDDAAASWLKVVESGHTYFPVIEGDATNIIGVVSIKKLMATEREGRGFDLRGVLSPPLFVPETVPVLKVLEKFKTSKTHMGFVVDEHGGIEGVITVTDVLKAVVGDLPSSGDEHEDPSIVQREDGSWLVDGKTPITELMETLRIRSLPKKHAGDYTTVGGLVITRLGRIPAAADSFRFRGYRFEVMDMDRRRVDKVLVTKMPRKVPGAAKAESAKAEAAKAEATKSEADQPLSSAAATLPPRRV